MSDCFDLSELEKGEKISGGSSKKVFKAVDKSGKVFAAHIFKNRIEDDEESKIIDLKNDISTLRQLSYPSVLKLIGYSPKNFKNKSYPTIITEFLPNSSLKDVKNLELKSRSLSNWNDTTKLINIYGIASGMSYLHEHGIIHGHLKTSVILEDENLFPKISDYWISKLSYLKDDELKTKPNIYTPPENLNSNNYTKEGDVYSFAMIIYEIFSENIPFNQNDRPEFNFQIPKCYKNLIKRCWSQNPSERPKFDQIVEELRSNEDFITEKVDREQYQRYIKSFTASKQISIEKVPIEFQKIEGFDHFTTEIQNMFIQAYNESSSEEKTIIIPFEKVKLLSSMKLFQTKEFSTTICVFYKIVFEVNFPCEDFESLYFDAYENYIWYKNRHDISVNIVANSDLYKLREFLISNPEYEHFVVISPSIDKIENECFSDCSSLKHITIPSSITEIPVDAFNNCAILDDVEIPSSVTKILNCAFKDCNLLTNIKIPSSVTFIGASAFSYCSELVEIEIPPSAEIMNWCFRNCTLLERVVLPPTLPKLYFLTFYECNSLKEIKIPSSVTQIDNSCFYNCTALEKVTFVKPTSLILIEDRAFYNCSSLKEIELPSQLKTIGLASFCKCMSLEKVSFDENSDLDKVGIMAFKDCTSLKEISFPPSLTEVGKDAFDGATALEQITVPASVKKKAFFKVHAGIPLKVKVIKLK